MTELTRDQLIEILVWNDPNGCYTDEDSKAEGSAGLTKPEAYKLIGDIDEMVDALVYSERATPRTISFAAWL